MTADHNAAARELLTIHCGDPPCTFMDERSCGCFKATIAALDRARQEGRREGLEEAAKVSAAFFDRWYRDHNGPFDAGVLAASAYVASEIRKLSLSAQPEEG
jgi:hypothetical protein